MTFLQQRNVWGLSSAYDAWKRFQPDLLYALDPSQSR